MGDDLQRTLDRYAALVGARLEEVLPRRPAHLLSDAAWHHLDGGGKRLRPALCLATCEALGGRPEPALDFAVAVELLHNMLLVHDDLEDRDRVRRDRPTVWVRYGEANAVNVGDFLLGRAWRLILDAALPPATRLRLLESFAAAYEQTVEGQSLDLNSRADPDFTVERYLDMARLKTGCYLALGMVGGAIVAGAGDEVIETLWEFGRHAGPAFQIRDDVIDLTAGKGRGGAVGCDIAEGKPSALYAHALAHAADADRSRLIEIMAASRDDTSAEDVRWVAALYRRLGSPDFAGGLADELLARAKAALAASPLGANATLNGLIHFLISRAT